MQFRTATNPRGYEAWLSDGDAYMRPCAEWIDFEDICEYHGARAERDPWICGQCEEQTDAIASLGSEYGICRDCFESGWYARLTAPGYMDATDWIGPFPTVFRAVRELCRFHEVDLDGNAI